jgi:hypothetical protein
VPIVLKSDSFNLLEPSGPVKPVMDLLYLYILTDYYYYYYYYYFSDSAAQRGLWPPVALQPSAGYGLLWLCSPLRAMAPCGSAAKRGLWPPVALQPSAGYGLLWLCNPVRAMVSCDSAAQRGLWPPRTTRFLNHTRRATVGRTPLDE